MNRRKYPPEATQQQIDVARRAILGCSDADCSADSIVVEHKKHPQWSGMDRIVLHIVPTMSPDVVRELYRRERSKYCNYSLRVSYRHLLAATHAFAHCAEMTWPEKFKEHNRLTEGEPELQYKEPKFFKRDAIKAYKNLMELRKRTTG